MARTEAHAERARHHLTVACDAELKAFEHTLSVLSEMERSAAIAMTELAADPSLIPEILIARMRAVRLAAVDERPLASRERRAS